MASSTFGTTLKWGSSSTSLSKKIDIKDYPDMIGEPNLLETTTLSDDQQTFVPGIKQAGETKAFTVNHTPADYALCQTDEGTKDLYFSLEFDEGDSFTWQGEYTLGFPGKGVDEVKEFTVNVIPSTVIKYVPAPSYGG